MMANQNVNSTNNTQQADTADQMPKDENAYAHKSYIKDIYIELPDYKFLHGPIKIEDEENKKDQQEDERFIGRIDIEKKFLNLLRKGENGAYLITGYRGTGKTSFVNRTINKYTSNKTKKEKPIVVSLFLNQEENNIKNIYRQMALGVREKINKEIYHDVSSRILLYLYKNATIVSTILTFIFLFTLVFVFELFDQVFGKKIIDTIILTISLFGFSWFLLQGLSRVLKFKPNYKYLLELDKIIERASAELTQEKGVQSSGAKIPLGFINKNVKKYPIANAKELEQELIDFFKRYSSNKKGAGKKIIIVFDELDKVEPLTKSTTYHEELGPTHSYTNRELDLFRERRTLIIGILGSLKHFITSADARFIFIAGREMFDASLADINDRQSSISSIFHQIINVESFLKDDSYPNSTKGITSTIHEYLKEVLMPKALFEHKNEHFLKTYYEKLTGSIQDQNIDKQEKTRIESECQKIVFTLQNYIIYLTYRSHGVPHKMNRVLEEMIVTRIKRSQTGLYTDWRQTEVAGLHSKPLTTASTSNEISKALYKKRTYQQIITYVRQLIRLGKKEQCLNNQEEESFYLKITPNNQYRFAFIAYLYRPFILAQSRYLKQYSDQVLVSTPYLMDHLIKFHPFAFSLRDLELLPEVLSSNRQPIIRYFTEELVTYLRQSFIRTTDIALFDYAFFKKQQNEIKYLSKIFESESAAFNFTLDENYEIKLQIRSKIKELRSIYAKFTDANKEYNPLYSILYLNILLGDVHFFDQEYSDSVVAYQDALQFIRRLFGKVSDKSVELFILLTKINLKLGLTYEKMNSHELALGHYSNVTQGTHTYFQELAEKFKESQKKNASIDTNLPSSLNELLQIGSQGFLAKMYLQEKLGGEGATINKVLHIQQTFQTMLDISDDILRKENQEIFASFYNNLGTLLFYQNSQEEKFVIDEVFKLNSERVVRLNRWVKNWDVSSDLIRRAKDGYYAHADELRGALRVRKGKGFTFSPYAYACYKTSLIQLCIPYLTENKHCIKCKCDSDQHGQRLCKLPRVLFYCVQQIFPEAFGQPETSEKAHFTQSKLKSIANTLSKIADVILSVLPCPPLNKPCPEEQRFENIFREDFIAALHDDPKSPLQDRQKLIWGYFLSFDPNNSEIINVKFLLQLYYLAYKVYAKAGVYVSASFQLRKVLHLINVAVRINPALVSQNKKVFEVIEQVFVKKILGIISRSTSSTDKMQIDKFESYFGNKGKRPGAQMSADIFKYTSNSPEIKEVLFLFAKLKVKAWNFTKMLFKYNLPDTAESFHEVIFDKGQVVFPEQSLLSNPSSISSQFTRILELSFQERCNKKILNQYISKFLRNTKGQSLINDWQNKKFKYFKKGTKYRHRKRIVKECFIDYFKHKVLKVDITKKELYNYFGQLVVNSIHCLHQIINIINVSGINYMLSYSYLAHFHKKLGEWLKFYTLFYTLNKIKEEGDDLGGNFEYDIETVLIELLGKDTLRGLHTTSQFQLAGQNYRKALQLHSQGETYYKQIRGMVYLEDDYNDNLLHYCAALEKQQINSGSIEQRLSYLREMIEDSQLLDLDRYWYTT